MPVGDVVANMSLVTTGSFLTIQPAGTVGWTIHNIIHEGDVELYFSDGTNDVKIDADAVGGYWGWLELEVNISYYLKVKNTNASSKRIGYTGKITNV